MLVIGSTLGLILAYMTSLLLRTFLYESQPTTHGPWPQSPPCSWLADLPPPTYQRGAPRWWTRWKPSEPNSPSEDTRRSILHNVKSQNIG